jgi:dihydrofolate synthase/folylpolyglutamate synthase
MTGGMTPESPRDLASAKLRLDALVDWERRARSGMRPQLEPVRDLCQRLGDPHTRWRCVHVTGTKGKGSTAHLVATALQKAGWRTGLYTSPHVERVQERIRIHGAEVSDEVMASALHRALDAREDAMRAQTPADDATWFDVLTAAAFLIFAEESCAWVVLEVGLGGRLDSTNIATGEVCVVTNVELEHCDVLGPTRAAIARE